MHTRLAAITLTMAAAANAQTHSSQAGVDEVWAHRGTWNEWQNGSTWKFSGDELGYDAHGVGDVDGDGYDDIAVTYYRRMNPDDAQNNHHHNAGFVVVFSGATICESSFDPTTAHPTTLSTCDLRTDCDSNGCTTEDGLKWESTHPPQDCDLIDPISPAGVLGVPIWGYESEDIMAHSIRKLPDVDGDGRDEMLLGKTKSTTGSMSIWSYTDKYNHDSNDSELRWVQVILIDAYDIANAQAGFRVAPLGDINGDAQTDIVMGYRGFQQTNSMDSASRREGAALVYCLPPNESDGCQSSCSGDFWDDLAQMSRDWDIVDDEYEKDPVALFTLKNQNDYSLKISAKIFDQTGSPAPFYPKPGLGLAFGNWVEPAGDLDGDAQADLIVGTELAYYEDPDESEDGLRGMIAIYLSDSAHRTEGTWEDDGGGGAGISGSFVTTISDLYDIQCAFKRRTGWTDDWDDAYGNPWDVDQGEEVEFSGSMHEPLSTNNYQERILIQDADLIIRGNRSTTASDNIPLIGQWFAQPGDYDTDFEAELVFSTRFGTHNAGGNTYNGRIFGLNLQEFIEELDVNSASPHADIPSDRVVSVLDLLGTMGPSSQQYAYEFFPESDVKWARWAGNIDGNVYMTPEFMMSSGSHIFVCQLTDTSGTLSATTLWEIEDESTGTGYGQAPNVSGESPIDNWGAGGTDLSKGLNRAWTAGDFDGDSYDDLLVASWFYPRIHDGVGIPPSGTAPHYVRAGKTYVFRSPVPSQSASCEGESRGSNDPIPPHLTPQNFVDLLRRISERDPQLDLDRNGVVDARDAILLSNRYADQD